MKDAMPDLAKPVRPASIRRVSKWRAHLPIAVVTVAYLACFAWMPNDGFWINDNGLKFIQVQAVTDSQFSSFAIELPGSRIDPHRRFIPITKGFFVIVEDRLYAAFSHVFAAISALSYSLIGFPGLYIFPLLGGLVGLAAVGRLAGMLVEEDEAIRRRARGIAILITGLASPLWFYAMAFWEHMPAVGLGCWGALACMQFRIEPTPRRAVLAGGLLALPIYFRVDAYLVAGIFLLVAWASSRHRVRDAALFGGAFAIALLPLWGFQWALFGNPLGLHIQAQGWESPGLAEHLATRAKVITNILLNSHQIGWLSIAAVLPFYLCLAFGPWLRRALGGRAVALSAAGALMAGSIVLQGQLGAERPLHWLMASNGLFAAFPLAILGFIPANRSNPGVAMSEAERTRRILLAICVVHPVLFVAFIPASNSNGIHWGCRFLLPLYPIFAAMAAASISTGWQERGAIRPFARTLLCLAVSVSLGLQLYSLVLLHERKTFSAELNDRVAESGADIVISGVWYLPVDMARSFLDKPMFLTRSRSDRRKIMTRAAGQGARTALIVSRAPRSQDPSDESVLDDGRLNFSPVSLGFVRFTFGDEAEQ
jgi:hypothetical protein